MTPLVDFLEGRASDIEGRTIDEILNAPDSWIERNHSFIQWIFPTVTVSRFNHNAPILTPEDRVLIQKSPGAEANLKRALERMKRFYATNTHWFGHRNHNHLRISRILECVTLVLGRTTAEEFLDHIQACFDRTGATPPEKALKAWQSKLNTRFEDDA